MGIGPMTWALVLLAYPAPPEVFHIPTADFNIPITLVKERVPDIKKVLLYVSTDQGKQWAEYSAVAPTETNFLFHAERDGIYWFVVTVLTKAGQMEPRSPYEATARQKIVVDTKKPQVRLSANRAGEDVQATWEIDEPYPNPSTLKLEFHTAEMPDEQWTPVAATPGPKGEATFKPNSRSATTVRLSVEDMAGNLGEQRAVLYSMLPLATTPSTPLPNVGLNPVQPVAASSGVTVPPMSPQPIPSNAIDTAARPGNNAWGTADAVPPPAPDRTVSAPATNLGPAPNPTYPTNNAGPMPASVTASMPEVQIISKRQVKLDFEVDKFGPSGLGSVDVWVTLDNGKTWTLSPSDNNAGFPMPADLRPGQPVRGSVTVQLNKPDPTVYGFFLVVKSRAGRGKPPPRSGDVPQVRVEVDTIAPEVKLYEPKPDPMRRDSLILSWHAADRNFATNPITLEWAERKEGPWNTIGAPQLPNTGTYTWRVPPTIPFQVYLRLTARDTADNVGVDETTEPVVVDLSEPESPTVRVNIGK